MLKSKTFHRKKIVCVFWGSVLIISLLMGRLGYLMIFCAEHYKELATELHEREREIKGARGKILDANGEILADNKTVCTISVIHSQVEEKEKVPVTLERETCHNILAEVMEVLS